MTKGNYSCILITVVRLQRKRSREHNTDRTDQALHRAEDLWCFGGVEGAET